MSHHIHTTPGIIMNLFPEGEESLIAECLTYDLGRIYLHIQGAKKIQNKHRMAVFLGASVIIDCVSGRQYYRCTGIAERLPIFPKVTNMIPYERKTVSQVFGLIQRLVPSGIPIPEVFTVFERFYEQIMSKTMTEYQVQILVLVVQLRILGILGYWNSDWTDEVLDEKSKTFAYVTEHQGSVKRLIERILIETQMNEKIPT